MNASPPGDLDHLQHLNALLRQALELPEPELQAWLRTLPPEQQAMKPELDGLLARAAAATDTFMRLPINISFADLDTLPVETDRPGDMIGPYRLTRELGSGGMAAVWLAERADGVLRRQVALKLPHAGWAPGLAERMARERDILASLEHPNIARLYDAGSTMTGRPYLAMEYAAGRPIDAFAQENALSIPARLQLILQVAQAVAHAHARLVIHRDLKPSNILIGTDGRVHLLDFGVAKLIAGDTAHATQLTRFTGRAMTPDYASPEQIHDQPLTVASDVYSLGVVLYELLTRQRPYKLKRDSPAALEEAITEAEVPPASARASDRKVSKALRGDLDTILAKALKKDPAQRYQSMEALAADIERYLAGEPVLARPDSLAYRAGKFLRRHRTSVAISTLFVAVVVVGVAGTVIQARRAEQLARQVQSERDSAIRELIFTEAAESFLRLMLSENSDRPFTTAELLARADASVDAQYASDAALRARMQQIIANLYGGQRNYENARKVLDRALLSAQASNDAAILAEIECEQGGLIAASSDLAAGARKLDALIARLSVQPKAYATALITCYGQRAGVDMRTDRWQLAVDDVTQALDLIGKPRPARMEFVISLKNIRASAYANLGQFGRAIELNDQLMAELQETGLGNSPTALVLANNQGVLLEQAGLLQRAAQVFEQGIAVNGASGQSTDHALLINYAHTLSHLGRHSQALAILKNSTAASRQAGDRLFYGIGLRNLAIAHCDLQDWNQCEQALQNARRQLADIVPPERPVWGTLATIAARIAMARGDPSTALEQLHDAVQRPAQRVLDRVQCMALLARVEAHMGNLQAAQDDAEQAVTYARNATVDFPHSASVGTALLAKGIVLHTQGDPAGARATLNQALEHLESSAGEQALPTLEARALLADL